MAGEKENHCKQHKKKWMLIIIPDNSFAKDKSNVAHYTNDQQACDPCK